MRNDQRYLRNLERWATESPKEALMLPYLGEDKDYQIIRSQTNEPNLTIRNTPIHQLHDPMKEACEWAAAIDFQKCELCFVYGVGLGYPYLALKPWLKKSKKRMVVFLEDDLQVINAFMSTEIAEKLLKDSQVRLHYISSVSENDQFFKSLYWNFALTPLAIVSIPSYLKLKPKKFEELKHSISFTNAYHNAVVDEYLHIGGPFFFNFYQNLLTLPLASDGNKFFGQFKNVPAIICGAGPSLEKQMPLLKKLMKKALIFGCGSAMNALNAAGILPHFGAAVDPNKTQIERLKSNSAVDVPYFYRNRVHPEALAHVKGPRLYIAGCGGYDLGDWFDEQLKIKKVELEEGYNVVNLTIEIAKHLGCNPILIVGCDLAFTGLKAYAQGVEANSHVTIAQITHTANFDDQAMIKPDLHGHPTYTLWKWIAEASWIGEFAQENKTKTRVINATEGGIGFPNVKNMSLEECVNAYLPLEYDFETRIQKLIENNSFSHIPQKKIISLMNEFRESFVKCEQFLSEMIHENKGLSNRIKASKAVPDILHSGAFALAEYELTEEVAYHYLLANFNAFYSLLINREYDYVRHQMPRTPLWKKQLKNIKIANKKFQYLRNVCRVNKGIIKWAIKKLTNPNAKLV